jgi:hypothetical protein
VSGPETAQAFLAVERTIALLDRCAPENALAERARLAAAWLRPDGGGSSSLAPRWLLSRSPDLDPALRALDVLEARVEDDDLASLYRGRCEELRLEVELVRARGAERFRELARSRYPVLSGELEQANSLARAWLAEPELNGAAEIEADLATALRDRLELLGVDVPVVERDNLSSAAAVGDGVVFVSSRAKHGAEQVARIVLHEVDGHLLPRLAAKNEARPLFVVGARGAGEDEEGRALLLEERAGCLRADSAAGRRRLRELALRHLLSVEARAGADFEELMGSALSLGATVGDAVRLCERISRGGGLAREVAYLPAMLRVGQAFAVKPELEGWFRRGRVSLSAARMLEAASAAHSSSTTTGT